MLSIGFDDTDSPNGMCTTYLAYKIVDLLKKEKAKFQDFPYLIRFNPNIPWKTRGNGAVGLKIKTKNPNKIKKKVTNLVIKYSDKKNGANPGLVFYQKKTIPQQFKEFSKLALWQLVPRNYAMKFALSNNLEAFFLGNGQGLVGAIATIGYQFPDHTLELISYRKKSQFGKDREISKQSVRLMQEKTFPQTFNNYDIRKKKILIAPHGPDPVFYGIRGEDPDSLLLASKLIETREQLDGYMIFKSNQGTSAHLKNEIDVSQMKPYSSGTVTGYVLKEPTIERGGHVIFSIITQGKEVKCAVYKPTGITTSVLGLIQGDKVRIGGGVRKASRNHQRVLNLEFLQVLNLERNLKLTNPICTKCNKKMKSKGRDQSFECIKCGKKSNKKSTKEIPRQIKKKLYLPMVSAHRHLTRPKQRIGISNKETQFDNSIRWFYHYRN